MPLLGHKNFDTGSLIGFKSGVAVHIGSKFGFHHKGLMGGFVKGPFSTGRGDMGAGNAPVDGNTHHAVANGQRDAAPRDFRVSDNVDKRLRHGRLESRKRNKVN